MNMIGMALAGAALGKALDGAVGGVSGGGGPSSRAILLDEIQKKFSSMETSSELVGEKINLYKIKKIGKKAKEHNPTLEILSVGDKKADLNGFSFSMPGHSVVAILDDKTIVALNAETKQLISIEPQTECDCGYHGEHFLHSNLFDSEPFTKENQPDIDGHSKISLLSNLYTPDKNGKIKEPEYSKKEVFLPDAPKDEFVLNIMKLAEIKRAQKAAIKQASGEQMGG